MKKNNPNTSLKKNIGRACFSVGLLATSMFAAADSPVKDILSNSALNLGTPASFLDNLAVNQVRHSLHNKATFNLVNHLGQEIKVVADDLSVEGDGTLSMNGQVQGIKNSEFILQGNDDKVYGWVILRDQDTAFEYTTQNGQLMVDEIAITDVHPICDFEHHDRTGFIPKHEKSLLSAAGSAPHIGDYQGQDVSKLESKPGSNYVILLDTSRIMTGSTPNDRSSEDLWITWQIVAASFSMFDVNVTTNRSVYDQAAPSRRGGGTLYTQSGRSSCHFAFGTSTFCTLYKENDAYGQGRIAAHEYGHLFHLSHDGGAPGGEYHSGLADFQWVPVMGNIWYGTSWNNALYQWSKGEYSGASNREDDFNIITSFIPYKGDDNTSSKSLVVDSNGSVRATNNNGQIERNTDTDHFTFSIGSSGGNVNLVIDRTEHIGGGMLDVQAYIRNSSGSIVAQSNKSVNRSASFNTNLSAGAYTLEITGGAEGTPNHGFSKYSSLGYYGIEGTITGSDGGSDIEVPATPTGLQASNITSSSFTLNWTAVDGASQYGLQLWSDAARAWQDAGSSTTASKTLTGLTSQDQWVRVRASNSAGNSSYSNYIYVQLEGNGCTGAPSTPSGLSGTSWSISWNSVSGATRYDVQYWTGSGWSNHGNTTGTSYTLRLSGTQYVRVRATNSCGNSSYSNWITVY